MTSTVMSGLRWLHLFLHGPRPCPTMSRSQHRSDRKRARRVSHASPFPGKLKKLRSRASLPNSPASVLTAFSSLSNKSRVLDDKTAGVICTYRLDALSGSRSYYLSSSFCHTQHYLTSGAQEKSPQKPTTTSPQPKLTNSSQACGSAKAG